MAKEQSLEEFIIVKIKLQRPKINIDPRFLTIY